MHCKINRYGFSNAFLFSQLLTFLHLHPLLASCNVDGLWIKGNWLKAPGETENNLSSPAAEAWVDLQGERLTAAYGFMQQNNIQHINMHICMNTAAHICTLTDSVWRTRRQFQWAAPQGSQRSSTWQLPRRDPVFCFWTHELTLCLSSQHTTLQLTDGNLAISKITEVK